MVDMTGDPELPSLSERVPRPKPNGKLSDDEINKVLRPAHPSGKGENLYAGLDKQERPVLFERVSEGEGPRSFKVHRVCDESEAEEFWNVYGQVCLLFRAGPASTMRVDSWEVRSS